MAYPDYEKLFLIEVFLDEVFISNQDVQLDPTTKSKLKETCVMFQFLDYPPLVLCEEDFFKSRQRRSASEDVNIKFQSGKSCIFSVRSSLVPSLPYKFDVLVKVLRKVETDGVVSRIVIGAASIELGDSFAAIMHSSVAEPDLPLVKTNHGTFDVLDERNRKIGAITGLIRLSCFGQLIVTQFQVGAKDDAFMFKGMEPKEVVEIPGDSSKMPKIEVDPNYVPPPPADQIAPGDRFPSSGDYDRRQDYPSDFYPPVVAPLPPPPPPEEPGNYKEIVAEIRGHSLHIRVPMRSKKEKEICKKQLVDEMEGPICKYAPPLNLCDCDYPVPPEAVPRCPR